MTDECREAKIESLVGLTLTSATGAIDDYEMVFITSDGRRFVFEHSQQCSETVAINDVIGDLSDLIGHPLVRAEARIGDIPEYEYDFRKYCSATWTFYEFATIKGSVTVRWLGESNGYYSEEVSLYEAVP